jgi:DNA ligase-1
MDKSLVKLNELVEKLNVSNSMNDKVETLAKYPECKELLYYTYNPYFNYYLRSESVTKRKGMATGFFGSKPVCKFPVLVQLLTAMDQRLLSGHAAADAVNTFISENPLYEDLILRVIDRNLKTRADAKLINKVFPDLIPSFSVALASDFWENQKKVDFEKETWYASHKLDGCRCVAIIDSQGKAEFFSRGGIAFEVLGNLKPEVEKLGLKNTVLDGEICIIDDKGNENFSEIMKVIRRKDYTIPNPRYQVFDILSVDDFQHQRSTVTLSKRYSRLDDVLNPKGHPVSEAIRMLPQLKLSNRKEFDEFFEIAVKNGWEGLIIRKDTTYQGDRTRDMLKVKSFQDAEFKVTGVIFGPIRVIENGLEVERELLSAATIEFKGSTVGVGSGWSQEQRRYYHENPEELIGKEITVKYFEESQDQYGKPSLRFPTVKKVWDTTRSEEE